MGHLSKLTGELPERYGFVILAGVGNVFVNMWMAMNVGKARKKYEVMYPQMYHPEPNHIFNCIQRVHQNTSTKHPEKTSSCEAKPCPRFIWAKLRQTPVQWPVKVVGQTEDGLYVYVKSGHAVIESNPTFMFLLLTGGLQYPKISAVAGLIHLIGRIAYAKGYYTGDPAKRRWGTFGHVADLILLGSTVSLAFDQLGWWPFHK